MEGLSLNPAETSADKPLSEHSPERLCQNELSLPQIRSLVDFCEEKGCKNEYGAYDAFITDVPEQDKDKTIDLSFLEETEIDGLKHFSDRNPNGFEHIRYYAGEEKTDDEIAPSVYGRLYISPSVENTPVLMQKIIEQHQKNGKDLVCKIPRKGARNDRIVIYLTDSSDDKADDFNNEIDIIKEIQKESPELFEGCNKNKLWCGIDGVNDVYFGGELSNQAYSYGEDRARIIGEIFALKKSGLVNTTDDKELDNVFRLACLNRRVDPYNFGFYIDKADDTVGSAAGDVLDGYHDEEFKQEDDYLESKALVEEWLKSHEEKSWLGGNIPEFNGQESRTSKRLSTSDENIESKETEQLDNYDSAVAEILAEYKDKTPFEQKVMRDIIIGERLTKDTISQIEKVHYDNRELSSEQIKGQFEHDFNNTMNCGGFALEVFGCLFTHTNNLEESVGLVLKTFPFVRLQDNDELSPNEYRVLYRHQEGGFSHHFIKEEDGELIEKNGNGPVQPFKEWPDSLKDAPEVTLIVDRHHDIKMYDEDGLQRFVFSI